MPRRYKPPRSTKALGFSKSFRAWAAHTDGRKPVIRAAREGQAIEDGAHSMLANTEVEISPGRVLRAEITSSAKSQARLARGPKIRRTAEQPRYVAGEHVQSLTRRVSSGEAFTVSGKTRKSLVPAIRQLTAQHAISLVRKLRVLASILLKLSPPGSMQFQAARPDARLEMLAHSIRDEEFRVRRPAVRPALHSRASGAAR
jgi:hypothetical protein